MGEDGKHAMKPLALERSVKILVADEPADWVERFVEDLHAGGVDMYLAADEQHGLDIIRRQEVDLVVVAADNPRMGGLEMVRRVHLFSVQVPVIVVGSPLNPRWLQEALKIGVRTVLPRPVDIEKLVSLSLKILGA